MTIGRTTREQTDRWNQMTALRFHTGERHQKRPASLRAKKNPEELKGDF